MSRITMIRVKNLDNLVTKPPTTNQIQPPSDTSVNITYKKGDDYKDRVLRAAATTSLCLP